MALEQMQIFLGNLEIFGFIFPDEPEDLGDGEFFLARSDRGRRHSAPRPRLPGQRDVGDLSK
jgi:hypothetical protein